ncbi:MAG: leucine-rich repeat protein, partial [Verrucomicrobia bacterium]|nr:leucine-rich repeat protein [Verrucomicrobiota bacterium]
MSIVQVGEFQFQTVFLFAVSGLCSLIDFLTQTITDAHLHFRSRVFHECDHLISVSLPFSVTSIGLSAFACCTRLISVLIANRVATIKDYAFYECSGLETIYFIGTKQPDTIGIDIFTNCFKLS